MLSRLIFYLKSVNFLFLLSIECTVRKPLYFIQLLALGSQIEDRV